MNCTQDYYDAAVDKKYFYVMDDAAVVGLEDLRKVVP